MSKKKIKSFGILLLFLIISSILTSPLITTFINNYFQKNEERDTINDPNLTPKLSAPSNAHYFNYYKTISIDHNQVIGSGGYSNFPVLISIFDTDLRYKVQSGGNDIAFSLDNDWLDHEIELFDKTYNGTHARLIAWVRFPTLSGSVDTIIRMYYGNSTMSSRENPPGVWDDNYKIIQHLHENLGIHYDSTSNDNDGTTNGGVNQDITGKIDGADDFNGINANLVIGDSSSLDITNAITIEAWIKDDVEERRRIVTKQGEIYVLRTDLNGKLHGYIKKGILYHARSQNNIITPDTYHHVAFTWDGISGDHNLRLFHNGLEVSSYSTQESIAAPLDTSDVPLFISSHGSGEWWDGIIDEVRISDIARSANWIATEYNNQHNPSSFYTIGTEQIVLWEPPNASYFTYYKTITIDHNKVSGAGTHTDFPLLVSLIDEDLKYHSQPDGDDIAFSTNGDWLDHEIELFDQSYNNTHAQLIAWVRIPFLSTSKNTSFTMYYGNSTMTSRQNPAGVWNSNFVGVWHLSESSGDAKDSTSYATNGTLSSGATQGMNGQIDGAYDFNGVNEGVSIGNPGDGHLDFGTSSFTISLWFNIDQSTGTYQMIVWKGGHSSGSEGYTIMTNSDATNLELGISDGSSRSSNQVSITFDQWIYFVGVVDRDNNLLHVYKDGIEIGSGVDISSINSINSAYVMSFSQSSNSFDGLADEIRISTENRSADWIKTEYNNQYTPNTFYFIGTEKTVSNKPPNIKYYNYYKIITIDCTKVSGTGSHVNFPILISLLDQDLRYDVQDDGDDIAFSMDGKWLDHEIEQFNQTYSSSQAQLIAWVRVPFLSTAFDSNITMYYSNSTMSAKENPNGVWNSGYAGVWHFNEDPSGTAPQMKDSSIPSSGGSTSGFMTYSDQVSGKIDGSLDFDGNDDYVDFGNPTELQITGALTIQVWFKAEEFKDNYLIAKMGIVGNRGWDIVLLPDIAPDGRIRFCYWDSTQTSNIVGYEKVSPGQWYYVVGVFNPSEYAKLFLNGGVVDEDTSGIPPDLANPSVPVRIARISAATSNFYNGTVDEVRISNVARSSEWIATEYSNQNNPGSFYTVGKEKYAKPVVLIEAQINAVDLYGNLIPNATISMYQDTQLIKRDITDVFGSVTFTEIIAGEYNFTVTISSNVEDITKLVNSTSQAILIDKGFQFVDLICNVSTNFFEVIDVDGEPLKSGWILVGNATQPLQKCLIDTTGYTKFWWLDVPPPKYNYTVYYRDINYNPDIIKLVSDDIDTSNSTIQLQVNLTTVEFTILTFSEPILPISGAKLKLRVDNPLGFSIVNLTSDLSGKATLYWLTSSEINGNYSLQIEFFGNNRAFNVTPSLLIVDNKINFTVNNKVSMVFRVLIDLANFQTELISLNPTDYINIKWGSQLKLRVLFNVTKGPLLGPTYADSMNYDLLLGGFSVQSGSLLKEGGNVGRHYAEINTKQNISTGSYIIIVSAQKSGYTLPSDLTLQLNILENDLELNQSDNDDSGSSVYWADPINMTLKSYGSNYETLTIKNALFQSIDHQFNFIISDAENNWNLSKIVFNFYNISWNTDISNINITIEDPYGAFYYMFNISTHSGWNYAQGTWTGIILNLNRASDTNDNNFEFKIGGSFDNTVDIIADAYFIRDSINIEYSKFNISNVISLLTEAEGWVINNVTFKISNCYYTSNWSKVDLSSLSNLNITTNEGFKYSLDYGFANGTGLLRIDDRIIFPISNQFVFMIESDHDIIFDVIIKVEYIQGFYQNIILETFNGTKTEKGITNGGIFQFNVVDNSWSENEAFLWIKGITNGLNYFYPSELAMNITIEGQLYSISDYAQGTGRISLAGITKDQILQAVIETSSPVNFTLLLSIEYSRIVYYETIGQLSYVLVEAPYISGIVQYYQDLGYYLKTFDTSLVDADEYTVRFTINKDHYISARKDLNLNVLNRLTLLNGSSEFFRKIDSIYVKDTVNFTFLYTDAIKGTKIRNLITQYYIWESYDPAGNVIENGQGDILSSVNNTYILDFNTETRMVGEYLLIVTLEKKNYDRKNAMILLSIKRRPLNYSLSDNFKNFRTSIVQGNTIPIELTLMDPTRGDIPLINATITLTIGDNKYEFQQIGNGTYIFNLPTNNINAFFTSITLTGILNITREDYISEEVTIVITVKMEEIFPGMPTFYFLLILSGIAILICSIVGYRVYQRATVPTFVKRVRTMKKAIKGGKSISESVLYANKDVFMLERVNSKWDKIGLSLAKILDIKIEKIKEVPKRISAKGKIHELKPIGIILMKWDERIGTEILGKYPEETEISEKTLMQIYSTHEYGGERGIITLTAGPWNILSYYSGPEHDSYLLLILSIEDDPDVYEGGMADILRILIENIEDGSYKQLMPYFYRRLSLYPSRSDEEILALTYQDDIKRMIIDNLRDVGVITKSELVVWVRDKALEGFFDLDAILNELIELEIIKQVSVKGLQSELIVLINDIIMLRVPPVDIIENPVNRSLPTQFEKDYYDDVKKFFQKYHPTKADNVKITEILANPQVYETLKLLRTAIITRQDLVKLKDDGVDDIYSVLKMLWDNQMIKVFRDTENNEYYALQTDYFIDLIFPKYILQIIKASYEQKSKSSKALIEYLEILEDTYYDLKSHKK